ncbi:MAG: hypothetical protein QM723_00280 [Myxococcaceae bacterium]
MNRRALVVAVALFSLVASGDMGMPAFLNFKNLHDTSNPYKYYTDARTQMPIGLSLTLVQQEVNTAWSTWNAVSCSSFRAADQGGSMGVIADPEDAYDQFSVSGAWVTSIQDPMYTQLFGSTDTIALSVPTSYAGVLTTCDSYFNGVDYGWSVGSITPQGAVDVQTAILHENGHCMGLDHFGSLDATVVMNPFIPVGGQRRVLTPVDVQAACEWYPSQNAVGAPCTPGGSCGASTLQCVTQTINGVTDSFCTNGCTTGSGAVCDLPLVCAGSTLFSPQFNGACLRPDNSVTLVGAPCQNSPDCASALGVCQKEDVTIGMHPQWSDGYCYQTCRPTEPPCPANSACTDVGGGDLRCLESCRVGFADCRQGYACALTVNGGVCIPICYEDKDCGDTTNFSCRVCDGLCVAIQNATARIGDPCTTDDQCGQGQVCNNLDSTHLQKQCTQGCSRGCAVCPTGSSCHPLLTGELVCERDCNGVGSCAPGTQCLPTGSGSVCRPQCTSVNDCPVGLMCFQGDCISSGAGGGAGGGGGNCGAFCQTDDAGMMGHPKTDGGHGGGSVNTGGCGCSSTNANLIFGLLVLAVVLARRRPLSLK